MNKKPKDEDGYVDEYQIRKYSDCYPSSAIRIFTMEDTFKIINNVNYLH